VSLEHDISELEQSAYLSEHARAVLVRALPRLIEAADLDTEELAALVGVTKQHASCNLAPFQHCPFHGASENAAVPAEAEAI